MPAAGRTSTSATATVTLNRDAVCEEFSTELLRRMDYPTQSAAADQAEKMRSVAREAADETLRRALLDVTERFRRLAADIGGPAAVLPALEEVKAVCGGQTVSSTGPVA